ncbi:MAG TPA: CHAT domain-containing protein [Thermoanaerobaculia bacterium]|jgi:CHAT domain-containing protein|nr:CHAT domain-containing protein [Thermoanaerobaculia bacterium]
MSRCPDSARIAAYLDDRLFEEERRALEEHFAGCETCWRVFADSVSCLAVAREGEAAAAKPPSRRQLLTSISGRSFRSWVAAAALVLGVGVTGWVMLSRLNAASEGHVVGVEAGLIERRPVLSRFAGDDWKPQPVDRVRTAGTTAPARPGSWRYLKLVDDAAAAAGDAPNAQQLQRLGSAYFVAGHTDQGLHTLERAVAAAPGDAAALNDLAAAHLARGVDNDDGNDLAEALELVDRALDIEPDLLDACFNRALVLELLPLPAQATRAWQRYLELDSHSHWAAEARQRLEQLSSRGDSAPLAAKLRVDIVGAAAAQDTALDRLVRAHRQEAREAFELDLLPAWGEAVAEGDPLEATRRLDSARRLAEEWQRQTDDGSLLRQVVEIERAGSDTERFARGHQALASGLEALESVRIGEAATAFGTALSELPESSAAHAWAAVSALACESYRRGPDDALASQLDAWVARVQGDEPLRAHLAWLRGLLRLRRGEPAALALLEEALDGFEHLGEADHAVWLHFVLGDARALFGDLPRAWGDRRRVLAALPDITHPERRFVLLLGPATGTAFLEQRPRVGSELLGELSASAVPWEPRKAAELELWRSRIDLKLGQRERARTALAAGTAWMWQVDDLAVRQRLAAELQTANGLVTEEGPTAVASLSAAIERARKNGPDFRLPGLLLERARTYRRLGETSRAAADLDEGIEWLTRLPSSDPVQSLWSERLSGADALFDELVSIELAANHPDRAFAVAEHARSGRTALVTGGPPSPSASFSTENGTSTLTALRERLEPGTTLLYYCLLAKEAFVWRVDSAAAVLIRLPASPDELAAWGAQLQTDLAAGAWTARTREAARRLYRELVIPAQLGVDVGQLVIVPDGPLDQLPFAALVDPRSDRFLVEQQVVQVAPSATIFVAAQARARQLEARQPSILALGDPRPDLELYPQLPALPAAADEARRVAQLYSRRDLLLGERATRDALLARATSYDVVHFAGHALVNRVDPSRSSLALARAPGSTEPGAVFAFELTPKRFASTRLVVLAGCSTGSGAESASTGTLSLARAFLGARVPSVVASLWPVSDGSTVELMTAFHSGVSRGLKPAEALRAAQLTLLRAREPGLRLPTAWAAFQALGG